MARSIQNLRSKIEILIIAGEASGDLHAAGLLREFKALRPDVRFFGCGGDRLAAEGAEILFHVEEIAFLGFAEVIRYLPFIRRMMRTLLEECGRRRPGAVVLVDYPGFNLRFAERLRRIPELRRTPILYYISPQVWAWHASRVPQIARLVDRLAVIFDFEVPIYDEVGLKADFVGHPLLEVAKPSRSREIFRKEMGLQDQERILALLPGSRRQEVLRLFPLFLDVYQRLRGEFPDLKGLVGCSPALDISNYRRLLQKADLGDGSIRLVERQPYDLLAYCDVALAASGTVTLEAAILGTPLVMAYRVSPLTYWIGRALVKIPNIALVNVVAGKRIVPEFIQGAATPAAIAAELADLLQNRERREEMKGELARVKAKLGQPGASRKVAEILAGMLVATT